METPILVFVLFFFFFWFKTFLKEYRNFKFNISFRIQTNGDGTVLTGNLVKVHYFTVTEQQNTIIKYSVTLVNGEIKRVLSFNVLTIIILFF